jgi:hypothetical protein
MTKITKKVREGLLTAIFTATQDASSKQDIYNKSEQKFGEVVWQAMVKIIGAKNLTTDMYGKDKENKENIDALVKEIKGKAVEGGFSNSHAGNTISAVLKENGLERRKVKKDPETTEEAEVVEENVAVEVKKDAENWEKAYAYTLNLSGQDLTDAKAMALKVYRAFEAAMKKDA